jgi:hypothetical protein
MREPSNLPPGVTDRMIEDQQRDPYAGTRYEERAHGLEDSRARLAESLREMEKHDPTSPHAARWCKRYHGAACQWPDVLRRNPSVEVQTREILTRIDAELAEIDRMIAADEEERR